MINLKTICSKFFIELRVYSKRVGCIATGHMMSTDIIMLRKVDIQHNGEVQVHGRSPYTTTQIENTTSAEQSTTCSTSQDIIQ